MKTVLITGGAGFIGSALMERLIDDHKVVIYDNFNRNALKYRPNRDHPNLTVICGDILDKQKLEQCFSQYNYDIIFHCAAIAGITTVTKSTIDTINVDCLGLLNLCYAYEKTNQSAIFVNFSTSEIFGKISIGSTNENTPAVLEPATSLRGSYAASKFLAEHLVMAFHREKGLRGINVRPYNVYGWGQVGENAINSFVNNALSGIDITINGNGTQIRDWCYIDDFIDILMQIVLDQNSIGHSFNIGNGNQVYNILYIANLVKQLVGADIKIVVKHDDNSEDVLYRIYNPVESRKYKLTSKIGIEQGITRVIAFQRLIRNDS